MPAVIWCIPVPVKRGEPGQWVCSRCGRGDVERRDTLDRIRRPCTAVEGDELTPAQPSLPPFGKRLANFSRAAITHLLNGCPTCTQEQIDQRVTICRKCPLYRPDTDNPEVGSCTHAKCGCGITREVKFLSKVGWLDQACPLGKWPATA